MHLLTTIGSTNHLRIAYDSDSVTITMPTEELVYQLDQLQDPDKVAQSPLAWIKKKTCNTKPSLYKNLSMSQSVLQLVTKQNLSLYKEIS